MNQAQLRRWAAWGARNGPNWFVVCAPPVIGFIAFLFAHRARQAVLANSRRIYGERELAIELFDAVCTFVAFARNLTESLCPERFGQMRLVVRGKARAASILEESGLILVTAHIGPWDSAAMTFTDMFDRPLMMLMAGEVDAQASQVQDEVRNQENVHVVRLGSSPLAAIESAAHLVEKGVVVAQMDRAFGKREPLTAQLFDQPFSVPSGLIRLAGVSGCPLLPVFMGRLQDGSRLVQVGDPIRVKQRPSLEQQTRVAQAFLNQMEEHLREFPTQWFHFTH